MFMLGIEGWSIANQICMFVAELQKTAKKIVQQSVHLFNSTWLRPDRKVGSRGEEGNHK